MTIEAIKTIAYVIISSGILINLVSAFVLIKYPEARSRVIFSTKAITLGTGFVMLGVLMLFGFSALGIKALVCLLFVAVTSPVEANVLLKAEKISSLLQRPNSNEKT